MASYWTVTGDSPDQYSSPNGGTPVLGHVISFITGNGHRGSIFVPDDRYDPVVVKPMLQAKANLVDEVNALSHTA